ncbi:lycopene cyclase family protein [Flavobacterium psychrophilum]|uniref:lycopene cyclase family protein n=1 Tax=Flavobacterium psychrophilum TaxID=96345 RepID=UPI000B7C1CBE|nr:lycopene cyclase family protein [Flavobacterium psychrophilum]SNB00895.1 Lycopene cyclase [Flavobacterium psychrophilum]
MQIKYDYIFAGAGLASLMILDKMMNNKLLEGKKVLLLEPNDKNNNDRTWCFWEDKLGDFESLVSKKWQQALFINEKATIECLADGTNYKMIESIRFYNYVFDKLKKHLEISCKKESFIAFEDKKSHVIVTSNVAKYATFKFFNSVFDVSKIEINKKHPLLKQHFIGWFVKTSNPIFNVNCATFMDFSIPQKGNTRFMYVLPFSPTEALVEYTLFSANLLQTQEYEVAINDYLKEKGATSFEIVAKEQGNIPMTIFPFWKNNSRNVLHIGTAGGWTKASTGYTFRNTIKQSEKLVGLLKKPTIDFRKFHQKNRFLFYDKIFVSVLYKDNDLGKKIFSNMFLRIKPKKIFNFLDETSNLKTELEIILACPKIPFIKALLGFK